MRFFPALPDFYCTIPGQTLIPGLLRLCFHGAQILCNIFFNLTFFLRAPCDKMLDVNKASAIFL
jgi:hypothetical protein